jgi:hypothetical protein
MDFVVSSSECSDDESLASSTSSNLSVAEDLCITSIALSFRADRLVAVRMNLYHYVQPLLHENLFHVKYRMSIPSFNKLLELLSPKVHLNEKFANVIGQEPISCEIMLHCEISFFSRRFFS